MSDSFKPTQMLPGFFKLAALILLITLHSMSLFSVAADDKTGMATMDKEKLKNQLSSLQYKVACEGGTEPPFQNEYWDNHRKGIYVDLISGEALFSSEDKFDSGTGWPSFTKPIEKSQVSEHQDNSYGMLRTEVKSRSGAHLGHVFPDGPGPEGQRYCINSASLKFIPFEELDQMGYAEYKKIFSEK